MEEQERTKISRAIGSMIATIDVIEFDLEYPNEKSLPIRLKAFRWIAQKLYNKYKPK